MDIIYVFIMINGSSLRAENPFSTGIIFFVKYIACFVCVCVISKVEIKLFFFLKF